MIRLRVTDVRLAPAPARERAAGLLGFVSCTINGLRVDGLALRRTRHSGHRITLPRRRGHPVVRPVARGGTDALERAILDALREMGGLP